MAPAFLHQEGALWVNAFGPPIAVAYGRKGPARGGGVARPRFGTACSAAPLSRDVFTRSGGVIRVIRGKGGKITAVSYNGGRVFDLRYWRLAG